MSDITEIDEMWASTSAVTTDKISTHAVTAERFGQASFIDPGSEPASNLAFTVKHGVLMAALQLAAKASSRKPNR